LAKTSDYVFALATLGGTTQLGSFFFCQVTQGDKGKYSSDSRKLLLLALSRLISPMEIQLFFRIVEPSVVASFWEIDHIKYHYHPII
jgi:hypothetical protein